ncbi:acetate--CoA ligase family protein [Desulfatibacillum aliphaticivorans]|uniref:acetate--CoA ligase family protein n=1 Tax=Desulfatibacillum aliphaticivorans TaxID=218208 RepID=UPI000416A969|nr:CoA-binding protein [Desulfatibacillum aliphaticivorans]
MIESITESPLYKIVNPKSIAFLGASNSFGAMGANCFDSIIKRGFEGDLYPVHPRDEVVQGYKAYKTVEELPCAPDLAIMVIPTRVVLEAMEACGKKGIKNVICVTAGFKEVGGEGPEREKELVRIAEKYGIRFIGPNCIGVTNASAKLNTTFLADNSKPGCIGLASQSGSFVTQMFNYLDRMDQGFSTAFSVGNGANIDLVDCLEYLGASPDTKVIALYVEGIARGREFMETAKAIVPHKPIVAIYVGGSETGKRATFSHTGTMAGPDALYDGMFRQCGIIRASSIVELFDFAWALGCLPMPKGKNTAIQTNSGGPGATAADCCGRAGLTLPSLSPETLEKLKDLLPGTASANNPIDITFARNPRDFWHAIPKALLEDPNIDMLLTYYLTPLQAIKRPLISSGVEEAEAEKMAVEFLKSFAQDTGNLLGEYGKPMVGFTFRGLEEPFPSMLRKQGCPIFSSPERAAAVLSAMVQYVEFKARLEA